METKKIRAYTLVELLVVIGVLLIAFSVIFIGASAGDGAKLGSAQRTLSGLVKAARGQAILKNAQVRLIIHNDPNEIDQYRRFIGIVYFGTDSNDKNGWIAATQGAYLPKDIFFDSAASDTSSGTAWLGPTMILDYPRLLAQSGNQEFDEDGDEIVKTSYFYYEFEDNGTFSDSNAYLIFRAGRFVPGSLEPDFPSEKANLKSALIIRQSGTATLVDNPEGL